MENQNSMELRQEPRDIETVTGEIRTLVHQAQTMALVYAIEIGRRLYEAKSLLKHGEWGIWLSEKVEFSQSTANNMMKIFDEYGSQQITLFGAVANSQTLGNLPYTKALKLLALPADEREEFVENHDVESMSTREMDRLIKEKKAAEERAVDAEKELAELRSELQVKQVAVNEAADREQALREQLADAKKEQAAAEEALAQTKENTEVPESVMKKVKAEAKKEAAEAQKKAAEKLAAETEKKLSAAESQRKAAEAEAAEARARVDRLEKELKTASPEVATFKVYFEEAQNVLRKCELAIEKVQDEDLRKKFKEAMKAACKRFVG